MDTNDPFLKMVIDDDFRREVTVLRCVEENALIALSHKSPIVTDAEMPIPASRLGDYEPGYVEIRASDFPVGFSLVVSVSETECKVAQVRFDASVCDREHLPIVFPRLAEWRAESPMYWRGLAALFVLENSNVTRKNRRAGA